MFWVVRPRLTLSGVSGLGTLLSGSYIGLDPVGNQGKEGARGERKTEFTGLEVPPEVAQDLAGKRFTLPSLPGSRRRARRDSVTPRREMAETRTWRWNTSGREPACRR